MNMKFSLALLIAFAPLSAQSSARDGSLYGYTLGEPTQFAVKDGASLSGALICSEHLTLAWHLQDQYRLCITPISRIYVSIEKSFYFQPTLSGERRADREAKRLVEALKDEYGVSVAFTSYKTAFGSYFDFHLGEYILSIFIEKLHDYYRVRLEFNRESRPDIFEMARREAEIFTANSREQRELKPNPLLKGIE